MKDLNILDNFVDDREFRNYIYSVLPALGFESMLIEDVRLSDGIDENDNDLLVKKDGLVYTVQTFLNLDITMNEVEETKKDMDNENTSYALIVTNTVVNEIIKDKALEMGIEIVDRNTLEKAIIINNI